MIFKKFRTIVQAYKNVESYEELLNAKQKLEYANISLANTDELINTKKKDLDNLNNLYAINKERATLACFTPKEVLHLQNEKINTIAATMIDEFNTVLKEATELGKDHFRFTVEYPEQAHIKALNFIAAKLKTEGFKTKLSDITYPPGMYMGPAPWEIYMYVSVPEPTLLNRIVETFLDKPNSRKPS